MRADLAEWLRFAVPQALTGVRIVLAMYAVLEASRHRCGTAATLLLLGLVTDALDGYCARKLGVAGEFGQLFDFFADYLYFVVAPAVISVVSVEAAGPVQVFLLSLPCLFAAMRYARKAGQSETGLPGIPGSPGLPTVAYAFFVCAVALLLRERALEPFTAAALLLPAGPLLGLLMTARTRYPKLSAYPWILVPILIGLAAMPFLWTTPLCWATLALIALYVAGGPLLMIQRAGSPAAPSPRGLPAVAGTEPRNGGVPCP